MKANFDESIIETMKSAVKKAGKIVMEGYGRGEIKRKEEEVHYTGFDKIKKSFVTDIDIEAQKIIISELIKFKEFSINAEEKNEEINKMLTQFNKNSNSTFIIDPLDGTANYLLANPKIKAILAKEYLDYYQEEMPDNSDKFGVCISLITKSTPLLTVIYYPFYNQLIYAAKGKGTFIDEKEFKIRSRKEHSFEDSIRISQYSKINAWKHLFKNRKSYQSSSYNLKALLEGDILSYCTESIDYIDLCPTLLAYTEAGGFFGDENGNIIKIADILETRDEKGRIHQSLILCPTQEYCYSLLNNLKAKSRE